MKGALRSWRGGAAFLLVKMFLQLLLRKLLGGLICVHLLASYLEFLSRVLICRYDPMALVKAFVYNKLVYNQAVLLEHFLRGTLRGTHISMVPLLPRRDC